MSPTHANRAASKLHNQLFSTNINVSLYASARSNHLSHVYTNMAKKLSLCKHDYAEVCVTVIWQIKCQK